MYCLRSPMARSRAMRICDSDVSYPCLTWESCNPVFRSITDMLRMISITQSTIMTSSKLKPRAPLRFGAGPPANSLFVFPILHSVINALSLHVVQGACTQLRGSRGINYQADRGEIPQLCHRKDGVSERQSTKDSGYRVDLCNVITAE